MLTWGRQMHSKGTAIAPEQEACAWWTMTDVTYLMSPHGIFQLELQRWLCQLGVGQLIVSTRECPPQLLPTSGVAHLPARCDLSGNSGCTHAFCFSDWEPGEECPPPPGITLATQLFTWQPGYPNTEGLGTLSSKFGSEVSPVPWPHLPC